MLIQVCCGDVCFEWFDWKLVEINTDDYGYFSLDYRMGSWHLIGYYKRNEEWIIKMFEEKDIEVLDLIYYLKDHPIMIIGFSLAGLMIGVSMLVDKKYNQ